MSDEVDWSVATNKVANLFIERVKDIRRDIPAGEIVSRAVESLVSSSFTVTTTEVPGDIDIGLLSELIGQINQSHRERIESLANSLGEVVGESRLEEGFATDIFGRFAGEEESHVLMRVDGMIIKISKDTALKVLSLGHGP